MSGRLGMDVRERHEVLEEGIPPDGVVLVRAAGVLGVALVLAAGTVWVDRRLSARRRQRGGGRAGASPYGQPGAIGEVSGRAMAEA
ncbi:hypothetical protein J7F03_25015 [Streptomyces sp. ISL-43]|uniref:hypothetical protein n=1 Tax=Streptomyces sp. ISL-43 TaxID=2819183 RepID=UPI001BE6217A|nr:hypothetical protein [Streptomyces sp. ISL-43]MBT2450277.1 hypothetical protein [Streptomyces sp. ISL-43]